MKPYKREYAEESAPDGEKLKSALEELNAQHVEGIVKKRCERGETIVLEGIYHLKNATVKVIYVQGLGPSRSNNLKTYT